LSQLTRRSFSASAAGLAFASFAGLRSRSLLADPLGLPLGIQLWSVKDQFESDPVKTLHELRRIGFTVVETAGSPSTGAETLRRQLDEAGLRCPSMHINFWEDIEAQFAGAKIVGAEYVVSSLLRPGTGRLPQMPPQQQKYAEFLREMTLEDAKKTAELANKMGEKAKSAGLRYAYHNHYMEFGAAGAQENAYDVLLQATEPGLVAFEIDCGWMAVSGRSPAGYFQRFPGRFSMMHAKDFHAVRAGEAVPPSLRLGAVLGQGFIDYAPILEAATHAGLKYVFAEQEGPFEEHSPMDAARLDYQYLHSFK
jgi:sugar phosphate isomerase/epimerase